MEKSTGGGRHGLPRRLRQARGSACRRRRECAPAGHGAANVGAGEAGAIEKSSGGRANSLRIRRVAAYTAHSSVASPESRTTSSFGRGRKERQDGRFPRQGCGIPKLRRSRDAPRTIPETSDANRPGMSTTVAAGNGKVTGHKRRQKRNNRRRNGQHSREQPLPQPGRASGHVPQDSPRAFAQTNATRPALPPPETGHAPCPAHKKRRSAKPKSCRTPDRHGSGLARSLNRTFSYRMKLVRMTGSFSGSGTPAALPASKQRSIHAMFLAS